MNPSDLHEKIDKKFENVRIVDVNTYYNVSKQYKVGDYIADQFKSETDKIMQEVLDKKTVLFEDMAPDSWSREDKIRNSLFDPKNIFLADKNVAPIVVHMLNNDIKTLYSCQGHYNESDNGAERPYIRFELPASKLIILNEIIVQIKDKYVSLSYYCNDIYYDKYIVDVYPSDLLFNEFLEDNNDVYNKSIEKKFEKWINTSLEPLINIFIDKIKHSKGQSSMQDH